MINNPGWYSGPTNFWRDEIDNNEEDSVYCEECNSCGEEMCCPKTKCKYLSNYIIEYCKDKLDTVEVDNVEYRKALSDIITEFS